MSLPLRLVLATFAATLFFGVMNAGASSGEAKEQPSLIGDFFKQIFSLASPQQEPQRPRRKRVRVHDAAPMKKAAPSATIAPADLRKALSDALAQDPSYLRDVIADFVRKDETTRQMLAESQPKPQISTPPLAAPPQQPPAMQREAIEQIVREYLLKNPEVLQEARRELEKRQTAAELEKHRKAVQEHASALFSSPRQVVLGNPQGDVTMVEFFDYNCGYCKRAMLDMLALLKSDSNLKVVLKEFPVLGPGSVEAAKVAAAVRMQDKSGEKYLEFHQKLLGGRGQADKAHALAAAKEIGLDVSRIEKDMDSAEVRATIEESFKLAEALGLNGTPSYVIGKDVVIGAVGLDQLKEKINTNRCGKPTC